MSESGNQPNKLLGGKVIVVTGAGGGVGAGVAKLCAAHGASVVVNDLGGGAGGEGGDEAPAMTVRNEIVEAGGQAVANFADVSDWDGAQSLIADAIDNFGRVDGVVNNAGILRDRIFHRMERADWDAVLAVNLTGCFNVARAAIGHFKEQQGGAFVHMTSTSGLIGNFGQANYISAKLGLTGLSKSIAFDAQRYHVRSNCIAPFAWTRMVGTIPTDTPEQQDRVEKLKRLLPEKIAPFTVCLLSDQAKHVTGQVFGVRNNEIFLFSQPMPIRGMQTSDGWTAEACIERALPALEPAFQPLLRSGEVFPWDPV
jgi:NAD(P)-dependent dehydrogenase (short-subunit alcohol dehydrogenase family)